jgi:hypothetical protein
LEGKEVQEVRKRYILVGEAPARNETWRTLDLTLALKSVGQHRGRGMVAWLKCIHPWLHHFVEVTTHVNLLSYYPGAERKGSAFPRGPARAQARKLMNAIDLMHKCVNFNGRRLETPDFLLLCGSRVADAFGIHDVKWKYFTEQRILGFSYPAVVVPHPSGVSRWWNDPANLIRARTYLEWLGTRARRRT